MKSKKVNKNSSLNEFQSMADLVQTASSAGSFAHLVGLGRACHLDNRLVGERSRPVLWRVDLRGACLASDGLPRSRGIEGDEKDAVAFRIAAVATGDPGHELDHQPVSKPTWPPRGSKAATAAM